MTITTALPAGPRTKGTDASDTAGALTAVNATPRSISGRMSITIEDVAAVGQANFESALRQNTSMSVSNSYDNQVLNGDGSAPNVDGLINQLTDPTDPTAVATFDAFVQAFADQIDGLWASRMREVSIVANVDAYKLSARTFRGTAANGGPVQTFADYAEKMSGGWWTNKRMPATAATIARGIVYRMGRPGLRTASHPTWGTVSIDDIYSDSRSGQRHFTVHMLVGSKVLIVQPEAYSLNRAQGRVAVALRVVQSPGCSDVLTKDELGLRPGEILIDTGRILRVDRLQPGGPWREPRAVARGE